LSSFKLEANVLQAAKLAPVAGLSIWGAVLGTVVQATKAPTAKVAPATCKLLRHTKENWEAECIKAPDTVTKTSLNQP
jgi:hypothetical protein